MTALSCATCFLCLYRRIIAGHDAVYRSLRVSVYVYVSVIVRVCVRVSVSVSVSVCVI